jgi:hypothetical protein
MSRAVVGRGSRPPAVGLRCGYREADMAMAVPVPESGHSIAQVPIPVKGEYRVIALDKVGRSCDKEILQTPGG